MKRLIPMMILILAWFALVPVQAQRADKVEMVLQSTPTAGAKMVFSPDGRLLATDGDKSVMIWDVATMHKLRTVVETDTIEEFVFAGDGGSLLTRTFSRIDRWDIRSGKLTVQIPYVSSYRGTYLAADKGRIFITNGADRSTRLVSYDLATGKKLLDVPGPESRAVAMTMNGLDGTVLCAYLDGTIRYLNPNTGSVLRTVMVRGGEISALTTAPDGKLLAAAVFPPAADPGAAGTPQPEPSPEPGKAMIQLLDLKTGTFKRALDVSDTNGYRFSGYRLSVSHSGSVIAGCNLDCEFWQVETGSKINMDEEDAVKYATNCVFSGRQDLLACHETASGEAITVRNSKTMKWVAAAPYLSAPSFARIAFSPDGKTLLGSSFPTALQWDLGAGSVVKRVVRNDGGEVKRVLADNFLFSPDGKYLAIADYDTDTKTSNIALVDAHTNEVVKEFHGIRGAETGYLIGSEALLFSPDGSVVAAVDLPSDPMAGPPNASQMEQAKLRRWNVNDGTELSPINVGKYKNHLVISPDGRSIAGSRDDRVDSTDPKVKFWEFGSGKEIPGPPIAGNTCVFHPKGRILACRDENGTIAFWDFSTGQRVSPAEPFRSDQPLFKESLIRSFAFTPDGSRIITNNFSGSLRAWDTSTGQLVREFTAERPLQHFDCGPDGKLIAATDIDQNIVLWDLGTGTKLASLITLGERDERTDGDTTDRGFYDWLVVTPEGFFDGTAAGWKMLGWRFNGDAFDLSPVEAFFKDFYYPGLLGDVLSGKAPAAPRRLANTDRRQPSVNIVAGEEKTSPDEQDGGSGDIKLVRVEVAEAPADPARRLPAGEARDIRLFRNGSLIKIWHGNNITELIAGGCKPSGGSARTGRRVVCETEVIVDGEENRFEAYAFNRDNVKSNDATITIKTDRTSVDGRLYVLAIGVDHYAAASHDLRFAVADATEFSNAVKESQEPLGVYLETRTIVLTDEFATKKDILTALKLFGRSSEEEEDELRSGAPPAMLEIAALRPQDALVVYFAGHGIAANDRFFLVPHDGFPPDQTGNGQQRARQLFDQSISDLELQEAFERLNAGRTVFIIDACNAGQALEAEDRRRGPMNSRGLAQLAYEKGMFVLAAAQSQQAALEVSRFGHGLLTYALLEGLKNADKNPGGEITERRWLDYAVRIVPELQLDEMRKRDAEIKSDPGKRGAELVFVGSGNKNLPPEKRGLQTPRVFYRQELIASPLVVSKP